MASEQKPRLKRTFTTKRKRLEADLEHVTEEMYRKNLELVSTNRTLALLRRIDTIVLEEQASLRQLSQQISDAIVSNSNFNYVAIFSKGVNRLDLALQASSISEAEQADGHAVAETVAAAQSVPLTGESRPEKPAETPEKKEGKDQGQQTSETAPVPEVELPQVVLDYTSTWLKSDDKELKMSLESVNHNVHQLGLKEHDLEAIFGTRLRALWALKLETRDKLVGLMLIGLNRPLKQVSDDDTVLLNRLSGAVGVALDNRLLYEENQAVLKKLQKTNAKLRELDAAKDEFISMASHQLRTPLTSVKGYLSMVMEGDAGKVSKSQKELLERSFMSAQSMVYLIADLLNVSRMQTGKFVIENKPTKLAEVVEAEMSQLTEMAKSKQQELTYKKPKKFPILMLDETKIRQVVMNFTDNALHYTQNGGHITVELKDKGQSIEFTVTDDGLGVPASEQHHLFSKFYRAGNAKQARPDGTGLGLFMAKKVIVSQGGAIIFKSTEGKGSVFGFSFPKAKLRVTAADVKRAAQKATSTPSSPLETTPSSGTK